MLKGKNCVSKSVSWFGNLISHSQLKQGWHGQCAVIAGLNFSKTKPAPFGRRALLGVL